MPLSNDQLKELSEKIKLSTSKSESICSKIADSFEDDLMEFEGFPQEHFDFVKSLLSTPTLYSKPGIWNFLMVLSSGRHRLTSNNFRQLSDIFIGNYSFYEDEDLCLATCDFIARNFPSHEAGLLLKKLKALEIGKPLEFRGAADEGLIILNNDIARMQNKT